MRLFLLILILNSFACLGCQEPDVPNSPKGSATPIDCSQVIATFAPKGRVSTNEVILEITDLKSKNPTWDLDEISSCLDMAYKISCTNNDCTFKKESFR